MSRLGSLYSKLGEPDGEMSGCCETADWAAEYIEELQTELNEQCRLLGMSAERELALNTQIQKLISERNAFDLAIDRAISGIVPDEHPLRSRLVEIAAMRAQPAPSVPAPIEGAKYMSNDWFYAEGWNDCRAEVLDAQPAPRVPDGWPTDEMVSAFAAVINVLNQKATFGPAFRAALAAAPGAQEKNDGRMLLRLRTGGVLPPGDAPGEERT